MRNRTTASVVASPVLVGAVTLLIVIVAVFLAYNANKGLPFVPTYDVKADVPGSANLVEGNEVRVGGFRVGVVEKITPARNADTGKTIAQLHLKLDKKVEPLATDTKVLIRPRSALGLKYVELTPGTSRETYKAGDTIPLANSKEVVEFDDFLSIFDEKTRDNSRTALKGYGDALAGRGPSLNAAIESLNPFFRHLTPVMDNLNDPDTELDEFFKQIGRASAQAAPVAKTQAALFTHMADTFEAIGRSPRALRLTIEKAPPTLAVGTRSFRAQRPFLADFADVSRRLRPAAQELPRSLPRINRALVAGQPVLRRSVALNERTEKVFAALDDLAENPNTLLALKDLRTLVVVTAPLVEYVAPYQTVCNYTNSFFEPLGKVFTTNVPEGTTFRVLLASDNRIQDNRPSEYPTDRPADVQSKDDPQNRNATPNGPRVAIHGQPYAPAIDAAGNADCQGGQTGYLDGPFPTDGRYPEANDPNFDAQKAGGSHVVIGPDTPGRAGGTYVTRELGIDNLKDVP
jgi:virulence factor Mce-like protein